MDEMIPFLRAIARNPDDDAPRLVFADWLDEHGQHGRAEFIRLQVELARMDPSDDGYSEKTARMRRCGVLTKKGKVRFFDYLPTKKCKIAFHRGMIESINTADAAKIDASGLDLIPLQALRTGGKLIDQFKGFKKLKWLELSERNVTPAKLLEVLGPKGWFKNLEELSLPYLNAACLEAGVIPKFDLPRLRNFFLSTDAFYSLGVPVPGDDEQEDEDDFSGERPWGGLPDYLPRNALPGPKTPLERFVWHSEDDCDFFNDEGWYWRGPTMESLLALLKTHKLKQIEVAVDYDDHEGGTEGVIAAPYQQNPLKLAPTLERVTLGGGDLQLLEGSKRKLKALRVYEAFAAEDDIFTLLKQPVCSELESLHIEDRLGELGAEPTAGPGITFSKLKALFLPWGLLGLFSNCQFPNLISLLGSQQPKTVLERKWPKLQCLHIGASSSNLSDLKAFAQSDCCPNLTTLTIEGYFRPGETDFSFLADCLHMPFLSLIRFPDYPMDRAYVVDEGRLIPVRSDVMLDDRKPTSLFRMSVVF